jgi:dihydrofolate reductase
MSRPALSLIAAVARNGAIGRDGALAWHDAEDLKHFRRVTLGCPVIMGRKTWDSLPPRFRPLPGRRNVVITRDASWRAEGAEGVDSLERALTLLDGSAKAFVIGGADIFALALPRAAELVLTEIDAELPGDRFFPAWDRARFRAVARESHVGANGIGYSFVTYKNSAGD